MTENPYKDFSRWELPVFPCADISSALESGFTQDGIYQIKLADEMTLDVLVQNAKALRSARDALVGFNGAVTQREKKKGPFFSGTSVTKGIAVPSISFSDPTLDIDGQIGLAWYAGCERVPDLPQKIAEILNGLASLYDLKLILFGGSGAGFAVLNISPHLKASHVALVWNPQTRIVKYFTRFVEKYVKSGFPQLWARMYNKTVYKEKGAEAFLSSVLSKAGVVHELGRGGVNERGQVLYLQNRHDWHTETHADPFLVQFGPWEKVGPAAYLAIDKRIGVVLGDWGEGHAAPPRKVIYELLDFCVGCKDIFSKGTHGVFSLFDEESSCPWMLCDEPSSVSQAVAPRPDIAPEPQTSLRERALKLDVVYSRSTSELLVELSLHHADYKKNNFVYAFYLMINGVRAQTRWYENRPYAAFGLAELPLDVDIEIIGFVKLASGIIQRVRRRIDIHQT